MRYVSLLEPLALHGMGDRRNEDTAQLAPYRAVVRLAVPAPLAVLVDPSDFACAALVGVVTTLVNGDFGNDGVAEMYIEVANAYLGCALRQQGFIRSEEHTSELQSLMRISYAVFCLKKKI